MHLFLDENDVNCNKTAFQSFENAFHLRFCSLCFLNDFVFDLNSVKLSTSVI